MPHKMYLNSLLPKYFLLTTSACKSKSGELIPQSPESLSLVYYSMWRADVFLLEMFSKNYKVIFGKKLLHNLERTAWARTGLQNLFMHLIETSVTL